MKSHHRTIYILLLPFLCYVLTSCFVNAELTYPIENTIHNPFSITNCLLYFYSTHCGHCENIKQEILSFNPTKEYPLYFIEYCEEILIVSTKEEVIENYDKEILSIVGVPSLMLIQNKKITSYYLGESEVLQGLSNYLPTPL